MALADKSCEACEGGLEPMHADEVDFLLADEKIHWTRAGDWLVKEQTLGNFQEALNYVNAVGSLAEEEGHHPDLSIHGYRNVTLRMQTHSVGGLTENDLILAAKIDRLEGQ